MNWPHPPDSDAANFDRERHDALVGDMNSGDWPDTFRIDRPRTTTLAGADQPATVAPSSPGATPTQALRGSTPPGPLGAASTPSH